MGIDAENGVSVVIPCFNNAECVSRAIRSALDQTSPPLEVIVVNDGSSDNSEAVIRGFGERTTYIAQDNSGPSVARNAGVRCARGAYLAFLDADDYWRPDFLARCGSFLEENPKAVAVSTGLAFHRLSGLTETGPKLLRVSPPERPFIIKNFFEFWAEQDHIRTGSCVIRRDTLIEAGCQRPDLRLAEDLELWGLLATYGSWGFVPDVLWDCDSERAAVTKGWTEKYIKRRRLCPTIDDWQKRIIPRLNETDQAGFRRIRGRVAAMLAHNQILAGSYIDARATFRAASQDMPCNWFTGLLKWSARAGAAGWRTACVLVKLRELQKTVMFPIRNPNRHRRLAPSAFTKTQPKQKDAAVRTPSFH